MIARHEHLPPSLEAWITVPALLIMRGSAAAGKSTLVEHWRAAIAAEVYVHPYHPAHPKRHNEDFMVVCAMADFVCRQSGGHFEYKQMWEEEAYAYCFRKAVAAVVARTEIVVIDQTNILLEKVSPYVALGEAFGYDVHICNVEVHPEAAYERAKSRILAGDKRPPLPLTYFENLARIKDFEEQRFPARYHKLCEKWYAVPACIDCGKPADDDTAHLYTNSPMRCSLCKVMGHLNG
jgi:predicted kinase